MSVVLTCQNIAISFGGRPLFKELSLSFDRGERVGLIGRNGSGKSTLLRILTGGQEPDSGLVTSQRGVVLGYLSQAEEIPVGCSVREILEAEVAADPTLTAADIGDTLGRCGFVDETVSAATLSGGWRKRLAIAKTLVHKPDFLLFDEPNNHLDFDGLTWLESLLSRHTGGLILSTHDRTLLDRVCTRIIEIGGEFPLGFLSHKGNYTSFVDARVAFMDAQRAQHRSLKSKVRHEEAWLKRGAKARTTKALGRIKSAYALIDDLSEMSGRLNEGSRAAGAVAALEGTGRRTKELVVVKDGAKVLGERSLFSALTFTLSPAQVWGVVGLNGSGKSTLLNVLRGEQTLTSGTLRSHPQLEIGYFSQHKEEVSQAGTLREALSPEGDTVVWRGIQIHVAGWAKQLGFRADQLSTRVSNLSGGERARVSLGRLLLSPADVLLLDEPTNDLDIPTLELLEAGLANHEGAVVVVTHDRFLLTQVATHIIALDGEGGVELLADYPQWEKRRTTRSRDERTQEKRTRASATPLRLTAKERRDLETIEAKILAAEKRVETLQRSLLADEVVTSSEKLTSLSADLSAAQGKVELLYERWGELEARKSEIEQAKGA